MVRKSPSFKPYLLFPLSLLILTVNAYAETGPLGFGEAGWLQDLQTDRPDFTEGTQTIQAGHYQVEAGYTYTQNDRAGVETKTHAFPELLLRIGIAEELELRLFAEGFIDQETDFDDGSSENSDGFSDMSIGFKHQIYADQLLMPDVSLLLELGIPVGDDEQSADEVEPAAKFLFAYDLSKSLSLGSNINFAAPMSGDDRFFEVSSSLSAAYALTADLGAYFEYFGFYPAESIDTETSTHFLNGGFTYGLSPDIQLDVRAGFGVNQAADDFFSGFGVSFRN